MQIVYSPEHARHNPPFEFLDGRLVPYHESPHRAEIIRTALESSGQHSFVAPHDHGSKPLLAVHSAAYLAYLEGIYERWVAAGGAPEGVMPSTFAVRGLQHHSPDALGEPGYYCFDQSAVVVAETYQAARAAADCALTAADLLLAGERSAYALCRPPGHHAGHAIYGGYCFLNNAAVAAQYLLSADDRRQTADRRPQTADDSPSAAVEESTHRPSPIVHRPKRVAILDIDFHHGNGTQEIFYERADVLYVSIHADPARHYPYFLGYAEERGKGAGEGYNINLPLERGITDARYLQVLEQVLETIAVFDPAWLVVSAGFDTYGEDPVARNDFALTQDAFGTIGARIAALKLPTLHVQEGGYAVEALGENVVRYLGE